MPILSAVGNPRRFRESGSRQAEGGEEVNNWNIQVEENQRYTVDGETFEHQYRLEHRSVSSLRLHEKPSPRRVRQLADQMRMGRRMPIPRIGDDGMMIDGHHRAEAAILVEGPNAVIPTVVHRIVNLTEQAELLRSLDLHLSAGCERVEAGFHFEEGGCFGMALALHATLTRAGVDAQLAVDQSFIHAYVQANSQLFDYQGQRHGEHPARLAVVNPNEFLEFARDHGHDEEGLYSDQSYAQQAIDAAFSLTEESAPARRVTEMSSASPSM